MPTYDYKCNACGHRFEQFQSMTAPLLRKCPKCGKSKLERLIGTGAAVLFKGSGFYTTDYRSDSYKKSAEADAKPAAAAPSGESKASTESKPSDAKPSDTKAAADSKPKAQEKAPPSPRTSSSKRPGKNRSKS
jgi:putative FmdB family regulatory protein